MRHRQAFSALSSMSAFQSFALTPNVQTDARWVIVAPEEKRYFAASGKHSVPPAIDTLLTDWVGEDLSLFPAVTNLLEKMDVKFNFSRNPPSFNEFYVSLNYNYPFLDYDSEGWQVEDRKIMDSYYRVSAPPPNNNPKPPLGEQISNYPMSPRVALVDEESDFVTVIQGALAFATGKIGDIHATFGPWIRKTSPSGGARHPTEVCFITTEGRENCPQGAYDYHDGHLYRTSLDEYEGHIPLNGSYFVITSVVDRSMWRYRSSRSLRPVLIDAGHVIGSKLIDQIDFA